MGKKQSKFQDSQKKSLKKKGSSGKGHSLQRRRILEEERPSALPARRWQFQLSLIHFAQGTILHAECATGKAKNIKSKSAKMKVLVAQSCPTLLQRHELYPTRLLCPWDSPGKNTGGGCHFLLQGIFPTQESNPGLLHCSQILYRLSHQGSPTGKARNIKPS